MIRYKIGLDIRMLRHSGIGTYLGGLLSEFQALGLDKDLALFGSREQADLSSRATSASSLVTGPFPKNKLITFNAPIYSIAEQLQYPALLRQCRLWHAPHY